MIKKLLFLNFLMMMYACKKEKLSIDWQKIDSPTKQELEDVVFMNENIGVAVGGEVYTSGIALVTYDGGYTWRVDTLGKKIVHAIDYTPDGTWSITGLENYFYESIDTAHTWQMTRPGLWHNQYAIDFLSRKQGVTAGGINYANGSIFHYEHIVEWLNSDALNEDFEHEMRGIAYSDTTTVHVVGYGYVGISHDAGRTWKAHDIRGDFFRSIHFPTPDIGYIIGYHGTILKTVDGGEHWEKLRNGSSIFVSDAHFRDVFFTSAEKGYIVGDNGLFWATDDGAKTWKVLKKGLREDLKAVFVKGGKGCAVGSKGSIIIFDAAM